MYFYTREDLNGKLAAMERLPKEIQEKMLRFMLRDAMEVDQDAQDLSDQPSRWHIHAVWGDKSKPEDDEVLCLSIGAEQTEAFLNLERYTDLQIILFDGSSDAIKDFFKKDKRALECGSVAVHCQDGTVWLGEESAEIKFRLALMLITHNAWRIGKEYLLQAAKEDHPMACYNMGYLCEKGIHTPIDIQEARAWYEKADALGDWFAQRRCKEWRA